MIAPPLLSKVLIPRKFFGGAKTFSALGRKYSSASARRVPVYPATSRAAVPSRSRRLSRTESPQFPPRFRRSWWSAFTTRASCWVFFTDFRIVSLHPRQQGPQIDHFRFVPSCARASQLLAKYALAAMKGCRCFPPFRAPRLLPIGQCIPEAPAPFDAAVKKLVSKKSTGFNLSRQTAATFTTPLAS